MHWNLLKYRLWYVHFGKTESILIISMNMLTLLMRAAAQSKLKTKCRTEKRYSNECDILRSTRTRINEKYKTLNFQRKLYTTLLSFFKLMCLCHSPRLPKWGGDKIYSAICIHIKIYNNQTIHSHKHIVYSIIMYRNFSVRGVYLRTFITRKKH